MFKKFVSISLATLLAFNLSACASKDISKNQKKSSSQNQSSSDENYADCESIDFQMSSIMTTVVLTALLLMYLIF